MDIKPLTIEQIRNYCKEEISSFNEPHLSVTDYATIFKTLDDLKSENTKLQEQVGGYAKTVIDLIDDNENIGFEIEEIYNQALKDRG